MTASYEALLPNSPQPEQLSAIPPLPPFAEESLAFVDALSRNLLRSEARTFPELVALAYWMRRANLERLRAELHQRIGDTLHVPRGTVLHIAPSNVDSIFVYSWFLSLLTGNRNIVRLSSKPSAQADQLVRAITEILADPTHAAIASRNLLVKYEANDATTERFSAACDVRVIWGGDNTVGQIRRLALPPTATEVAFSNKYSLALLHAARWLEADETAKNALARAFYNDSYWFDQMACSSPRSVLWVGSKEQGQAAAQDFWPRIEAILSAQHERFGDVDYINKLITQDVMAMEFEANTTRGTSNDLVRIWLDTPALHEQHHCGAGLFFESALPNIDALRPLLNRTVQTVSYAGFTKEELRSFVAAAPIAGIDRIVPFGHALDFGPVWDGFDLFRVFMREISVT
jgi:hypothetical protein